jgi:hypothetical protein
MSRRFFAARICNFNCERKSERYHLGMRIASTAAAAAILILAMSSSAGDPPNSDDCATATETLSETTFRAESWDPVVTMGRSLSDRYGINISVESPKWAFPLDTEDVAAADPEFSATHNNIHYLVQKRHALEIRFPTAEDGRPADIPSLVQQVSDAANKEMPYSYRVDALDGNAYALVPTTTRNADGRLEAATPLLDHKVTIPPAKRAITQHGNLLAAELSKQSGFDVACCESSVGGVPWGMAEIEFGAENKPAREILRSLISLEQQAQANSSGPWHPTYNHWVVRCDGTGTPSCSITVQGLSSCRYWRNPTGN